MLVIVNSHHVVKVAGIVALTVLGDDYIGIVESIADPLESVAHSERRDFQPTRTRSDFEKLIYLT